MSMIQRVISGISSNALVQVTNLVVQIVGIPLFIKYWGVEYYGEWIILFTIPGYIAYCDLGLGTAATTEMAMMLERGEHTQITKLLRNSFWFVVMIGSVVTTLLISSILILPWYDWLNFHAFSNFELNISFIALIIYVYLSIFMSLPLNYYRVEKRYHKERLISTVFKILEFGSVVVLLIAGYSAIAVALCFLFWRIVMLLFLIYDLNRSSSIFRLLPISLDYKEVQTILKPGISLLGFFLGQNFLNQGIVTVIGLSLGSTMVVAFTTVRTLVNAVKQLIGMINQVIFSEFSYAKGKGGNDFLYQLFVLGLFVNILIATISCLILLFFGQSIINIWTNNLVHFDALFFSLMVLYIFFGALTNYALTFVGALNQFRRLSFSFIIMAILLLTFASLSEYLGGLPYVAALLVVFELTFLYLSTMVCLNILDKKIFALLDFMNIKWQLLRLNK